MSKVVRELERRIVKQVIDDLLAAGRCVGWNHDGYIEDDDSFCAMDSSDATLDEAFACDELRLWVYPSKNAWLIRGSANALVLGRGWVYFVYGNDGYDVISDYTTNLEEWLTGANKLADQYA